MRSRQAFSTLILVSALAAAPGATAQTPITEDAKLLANDAAKSDLLGHAVAIDGNRILVSATLDDSAAIDGGSVYVFERVGIGWGQVAKLNSSDVEIGDDFGASIALNGSRAIITARFADGSGLDDGAAYVFERAPDGLWSERSKLFASDTAPFSLFGMSASIADDVAVVGSPAGDGAQADTGAAYVFERTTQGWVETAKLTPADGAVGDTFGQTVAVDGAIIVVGAPFGDQPSAADAGAAYVFERDLQGSWTQTAKLGASDPVTLQVFGSDVTVDDQIIVIAAELDSEIDSDSGAAYVFERTSEGDWEEAAKLLQPEGEIDDVFGSAVAVEGERIIVSGKFSDGLDEDTGAAYVFERQESGWEYVAQLVALDGGSKDNFGFSVDIAGGVVVIGSLLHDAAFFNQGAAYVFDLESQDCDGCLPDINGDGELDVFDFVEFQTQFQLGCPDR